MIIPVERKIKSISYIKNSPTLEVYVVLWLYVSLNVATWILRILHTQQRVAQFLALTSTHHNHDLNAVYIKENLTI